MSVEQHLERSLQERGIAFSIDLLTSRYAAEVDGSRYLVNLDNVTRRLHGDCDVQLVVDGFLDAVLGAASSTELTAAGLHWWLEPNDYLVKASYTEPLTPLLDRALVHVSSDGTVVRWITERDLTALELTPAEADARAWANLDRELLQARAVTHDRASATLLTFETAFPAKASLLLAPSLPALAGPAVGWPVLAVAPDRQTVHLWAASERRLLPAVGQIANRERESAPYPLSPEVFEIDDGLRAIGTYLRCS